MRITIVTGFFLPVPPVRGGATEKIWHELARRFAAAGHAVTFVSRRWPGFADLETVDGVRHVRVRGVDHTGSLAKNLWHDFWWGVRVARRLPPADVTVCNAVALPAWLRRVRPSVGRVVAVVARMPKGQGRVYGGVDGLFSLSSAVTARLVAEKPSLAPRIFPFPFPIDWDRLAAAAAAQPRAPGAPIVIGYIGRLHPEKGVHLLAAACARLAARKDLPPWRLVLLGPQSVPQGGGGDAYLAALRSELAAVPPGRLELAPPEFDPAALARRYAAIDVFCYPSLAEGGETFGVAVAEAMAAGAAPVVSDLACFRDLVTSGANGVVFDHRAPDAIERLASALADLVGSPSRRAAFGAEARRHVRKFDYAASADAVLAEFERLVSCRPRTAAS